MDIKHAIFEPGKSIYFSTYPPPTFIHMSHHFTSALKPTAQKSFDCCLSHFCTYVSTSSSSAKHLPPSCQPFYVTHTSHHKQETFLNEYPLHSVLLSTEKHITECCSLVVHPQAQWPFWLLKPASKHAHAHLLPRLLWSWTVRLPSDTHRKPIMSITAVLLPFVTYLAALPYITSLQF
jgi:hypothetical protein